MVLEHFLSWVAAAPARARADAARALIEAYGRLDGDAVRRGHLDRMVAVLLDDPVITVRQSLADAAALRLDLPRSVVVALSRDDPAVSLPVLRASQLLSATDLIAALEIGGEAVQVAIASRSSLADAVSAALASEGDRNAVLALCRNVSTALSTASLRTILARFGADGDVREAILQRDDVAPALRHDLVVAAAQALTTFAVERGWMSVRRADHATRESLEKAAVTIAADSASEPDALDALVVELRTTGRLTPALLLRALLSGEAGLFITAVAQLTGVPCRRVQGVSRAPWSLAFATLYARAAMPRDLLPAFRAALVAAQRLHRERSDDSPVVQQRAIDHVRSACSAFDEVEGLRTLLGRLESEAWRDEMRLRRDALQTVPDRTDRAEPHVWMLPKRPSFRLPFRVAA
jgi:uncharacterized protein (DUF2336 family)